MRRFLVAALLGLLLASCGSQPAGGAPTSVPAATAAPAPAEAPTSVPAITAAPAPAEAPTTRAPAPAGDQPTLTLMTHDSFSISEDVLKEFEQQEHVKVQVLKSGDAGSALNKAILSKSSPLAD